MITIETCKPEELTEVRELFRGTIQIVNTKDYDPQQIQVWSSAADDIQKWENLLATQHFLVAKLDHQIVGFGTMTPNGYLDAMYVHANYQRKGIAQALLHDLLQYAQNQNIGTVWSDVSITARPFFDKNGFVVEREQRKMYKEMVFVNYIVYKKLVNYLLETERLLLRPFILEDAQDFYDLNADPEVTKYTGDSAFENVAAAADFIRHYHPYRTEGMGRWAVIRKSDGAYLGWCGLRYVPDLQEVDLGYRFFKKYWGQGYATESSQACIAYGFNVLKLKTIVARAMKENIGSIQVMKKLSMQFEKELIFAEHPGILYRINQAGA
ncbi:MAG: GNAT family N-acetyltransferase [Saprospiraceae bacterium]